MKAPDTTPKAYRLNDWLAQVGFGRSKFYTLSPELKPRTVHIGKLQLITEQPADWLGRVAQKSVE